MILSGCPHCHIIAFLHPDDKLKQDLDKIDQLIWAEIPVDNDSGELNRFLTAWRKEDSSRSARWKEVKPVKEEDHDMSCDTSEEFNDTVNQTFENAAPR